MIQWHWISSAVCLVGMLLFTITGITLNHAGEISAEPVITTSECELPRELLARLNEVGSQDSGPLPTDTARWLSGKLPTTIGRRVAEWHADEVYLSMPGPGSDAWLSIDR